MTTCKALPVLALVAMSIPANNGLAAAALEPCSVLSAQEASSVIKAPVKQDVPSPIKYQGISVGGTCLYRSQNDWMVTITVRSDATPAGGQRQMFEAGLKRATAVSGIGDRAYLEARSQGPSSVTFLRGDTLATVTVEGLGIDAAKSVAVLVAPRLPSSIDVAAQPPPAKGTGKLDPALVGSWFLTQADGRGLATLTVESDGRFFMTLLAGNKTQSGQMDGQNGVLHLYPERGGTAQEIRYRSVQKDQMEWTDAKGTVLHVRRQFR
jgi:hypothetical protein